jgi:hypothetical protein
MTNSAIDLSGGLADEADLCVVTPPDDDPYFGENHALWLWDEERSLGLHLYLKTIGHVTSFSQRRETIYAFMPDGSVRTSDQDGPGPTDPRVVKGPNLVCTCIEPFRHWQFRYDCTARVTTASEMQGPPLAIEPPLALSFDIDVRTEAPPWMLGTYSTGDSVEWARQFFGDARYEQLISATGTIRTEAGEHDISAVGMRTHRIGRRNTGSFPGHTWLTGLFPGGRSFGLQKFCGADGVGLWQEAWVSHDGERHPAQIVEAPLFSQRLPGEELIVELDSDLGRSSIRGVLRATNFVTSKQPDPQKFCPGIDRSNPASRIMSQGLAHYEWDGEIGAGHVERSMRVESIGPTPS